MADYSTMPDAVLGRLRSSAAAATVGDTYLMAEGAGRVRFAFDYLPPPGPDADAPYLPYVVITEPGESREYFTRQEDGLRPFLADGSLTVQCWGETREAARVLAQQVTTALHDAPIDWGGTNRSTLFRPVSVVAPPVPPAGPNAPTVFVRVITIEFQYQGLA